MLVIGAGVAGLAAIQQAKAQGATVRAFDVRQTCREQVEAVGGEFLVVPGFEDEDGAGGDGWLGGRDYVLKASGAVCGDFMND